MNQLVTDFHAAMTKADTPTLRIEQHIRATPARVYHAWTDGEQLKKWSAPAGMTVTGEADLRVGGAWRCEMREPNGTAHIGLGEYLEVVPNTRLVYTHAWATDGGAGKSTTPVTTVMVEFLPAGEGTLVILQQVGFGSIESRDGHASGWGSCMEKLDALFPAA